MTVAEPVERRARRLRYLLEHPTATDADAGAVIDEELAQEALEAAAGKAHIAAVVSSFVAMTACGVCRVEPVVGIPDGLCARCRPVVGQLRAEQLGSETVNGQTRHELAAAYVARTS